MFRRIRPIQFAFACLLLAAGFGCSRTPVPVQGVVLWEDGKPVSDASLRFVPVNAQGRESMAVTDKDGEFQLSTFYSHDGTYPGEYKVVITKFASTGGARPPEMKANNDAQLANAMKEWWDQQLAKQAKVTDPVPAVYASEKSTPLRWTVESGGKKVELKLKRT